MSRPKVTLANHEAVYRFYEHHDQNMAFARFAHFVLARVFKLDLTFDEGADDAITELIESGTRIIISPNHITGDDQYVVVAIAEHFKALRPLRGVTFIPAEPSLFSRKGMKGKLLRRAVDELGALPTFRLEDLRRQKIEITDAIDEQYRSATVLASDIQMAKLVNGKMMAGFWEGTRNRNDYRVVQPLKKGIAYTAIAAAESVKVAVLPIGIYYGAEPDDYRRPDVPGKRKPHIHVGTPIAVETSNAAELVEKVYPEMQRCVDVVVKRAERIGSPSVGETEVDALATASTDPADSED